MMVDITKFWIEGILLQHFPQFFSDAGADLDGNGAIEGTELFSDFDCDSFTGNHEDYETYLELNRSVLSERIPFFRWGEKLRIDNRIHQLMYLESDLVAGEAVESAYLFISELLGYVNVRSLGTELTPRQESRIYYDVMKNEGKIVFGPPENSLFISNIIDRHLDCDTSSFLAMAFGDERGLTLHPVAIPEHTFLRGKDENGREFNIDFGNFIFNHQYRVDQKFLLPLYNEQLESLFLDNRGFALEDIGHHEEALATYDRAIQLGPDITDTHVHRGVVLKHLGRYEEALAALDRAIQISPNVATPHSNRSIVLEQLGRYEEALAACDRAIQIDPNVATPHSSRGSILLILGRNEEALTALERAIQIDPNDAGTHSNLGAVLKTLGRYEEALAAFDHAIQIDPNNDIALYNRGVILIHLHRYEEALAVFDRIVQIYPDQSDMHSSRGVILFLLHRYEAALAAYDRAIQIDPDNADAAYNRRLVLEKLARTE